MIYTRALTAEEINELRSVDSDGDGTSDYDEGLAGTNANDASEGGRDDPNVDTDNDGINNALDAVHTDAEINWVQLSWSVG